MNSSDSAPRVWITSEDIQNYRKSHPVSWGPLGERVYDRTYSRPTDTGKEDWYETCARVVNGNCNFVSPEFIEPNEPRKLYEALLTHQIVPGGRHLWATGVQTGNSAINNCHGADFTTRFSEHFEHMFMRLMEGGGVGSNVSDKFIQSKAKGKWTITTPHELHIVCADYHQDIDTTLELDNHEDAKLLGFMTEEGTLQNGAVFSSKDSDYFVKVPFRSLLSKEMNYSSAPISGEDRVYISVGDSREGWAEALVKILDLYVSEGPKKKIVVDITGIRPHGAPIRTFGGTASGPGALMLLLARITNLFNSQLGVVTWKQVALIEHWIALAVISGGTRRSARMLMKYWQDPGIFEFIKLKEHLPTGHVPHHTTNISVVVDKKFFRAIRRMDAHAMAVLDAIVLNMLMNGEPGLVNASNQLIDEIKGAVFYTTNPCLPDYTWVDTTEGPRQIRDLVGVPFTAVVNGEEVDSTEQGFFLTGQKPLVRLYTNHGTLDLTEDHRVLMTNGDFVEAGLLEPGDEVQLNVWDGPSDKLLNKDPKTTVIDVVSLDSVVNVYDCTIPEGHVFSANGILVHNCGEITMVKYDDMDCFDVCCIGHLNLATLEDSDGKARLLARFLMRASMSRVIDPRMKMNVDRNHRLGAGILGYADWLLLNGVRYSEAPKNGEVKKFFSHLRDRITEEANNYAHTLRVVAPIKTTTIAPTGTIANLSGVTSGMQPVFAQYYIRRVRYADTGDQQTLDNLRSQGYNVYQDPYSPATSVVDFVTEHVLHGRATELFKQKHPELPESEIRDMVDDLFEDEGILTFTDVFANQEMLQECWANNAISVTANVRRETDTEELRQQVSEVTKAILFYGERLKGLTMFPEVSMAAAPLERLTKEEFNKYREQGYPIDVSQDEQKCVNGVCPIK